VRSQRSIAGFIFASAIAASVAHAAPQASSTLSTPPSAVLRANANLVLVDVVVTDHGNSVNGLDRIRFHILEDGREQPITSFDEHKPAPAGAASPQPALPPHTYTNLPAYPPASAVNILLLDALNTPMPNQMDVRHKMLEYLGKLQRGTPLAIFTLASRLRLVEGFTTDPAELTKALEGQKGAPQTSVVLDPESDQALDSSIGEMATMTSGMNQYSAAGITALSSMQQFQADLTAFQTDLRVRMTLEAMQQLARYLSAIPGRKNVIWFSGSFPIALDPDDALQDPFEAMRNYSDDIRETAELLSAARVAVYPVDARGLMTPPTLDASYKPSTNLVGATTSGNRSGSRRSLTSNKPSTANDELNTTKQRMEEQATMQQIAEQTGGREYINTNALKETVASAVDNGSSYYTVGYIPAARPLDGGYRKIEIRLDSSDYNLAYRHGYYADPPDKPSEHAPGQTSLIVAATLHGAPPSTQIVFQARVLSAADPQLKGATLPAGPAGEMTASLKAPLHRVITDLTVDAHGLRYDSSPDGALHSKVEFTLVAYDADGRRVNYLDRGFQINLKASEIAQTMESGIRVRFPLDMPEGHYSLRIAVHDLSAGRAGSLEVPLAVAAN